MLETGWLAGLCSDMVPLFGGMGGVRGSQLGGWQAYCRFFGGSSECEMSGCMLEVGWLASLCSGMVTLFWSHGECVMEWMYA